MFKKLLAKNLPVALATVIAAVGAAAMATSLPASGLANQLAAIDLRFVVQGLVGVLGLYHAANSAGIIPMAVSVMRALLENGRV